MVSPQLAFCRRLQYSFSDVSLMELALTHRSAYHQHNERLEFLGDALLNQIIAAQLYQRFPNASEGEMSRMRASLVKEKTLADIAADLQLGDALHLGSGELKSGGFRRESILADGLEAVFGAIYLDAGMSACESVVLRLFDSRLSALGEQSSQKDPKTLLQEWLQGHRQALPTYDLIDTQGDPHEQIFVVRCLLEDGREKFGSGSSRRRAEQQAAEIMLKEIMDLNEKSKLNSAVNPIKKQASK